MGQIYTKTISEGSVTEKSIKVRTRYIIRIFLLFLTLSQMTVYASANVTSISITGGSNPSCSGELVTFEASNSCAVTGVTYQWKIDGDDVPGANSSTFSSATLSDGNVITCESSFTDSVCTGSPSLSAGITMTINPIPSLSSTLTPASTCSGNMFSYIPSSVTAGAAFNWTRAAVSGIAEPSSSGTGNINEILTNTTSSSINVTYTFTVTANGCSGPSENVIVTVKPIPVLSSTTTPSDICSGSSFAYTPASATSGTSFGWIRAAVTGITEPASSGSGTINEILTNSTASSINVTYTFTLTSDGCSGPSENVIVNVKPMPVLSSTSTPSAVCSGSAFTYTPASSTSGTNFSWVRAAVAGISQSASSGNGSINETLTNTTANPINVTYSFSLSSNGCNNPGQLVVVTVNPKPVLSSTLSPSSICSGSAFSYTPESATTGATFNWNRSLVTGISQSASSGNGNINEILTNTTNTSKTVTYVFTTTANGCSGIAQNVAVTVKPISNLSSTLTPAAVCSGNTFSYTPSATISGSTFSWTRSAVAGISQASTSGTGSVSEVLTNTTAFPVSVTYVYTTTLNGCSNNGQNVTVSIKPRPVLSSTLTPAGICTGSTFSYVPTSATTGSTFSWNKPIVTGISQGAATGTGNVNMVLTNTTQNPVNVTYIYTLTAAGCTGPAQNVVVPVYPKPNVSNFSVTDATNVCAGSGSVVTISSTSLADDTYTVTYNLTDQNVATGNTATMVFTGNASTFTTSALTNTANNGSTTVTISSITNSYGCTSTVSNKSTDFNVDDMPSITSPDTVSICSGTAVGKFITTDFSNSVITWYADANPNVTGESLTPQTPANKKINDVLVNLTYVNQVVVYHVTPTSTNQGCVGPTMTMYVTVKPAPNMTSAATASICSGTTFSIPLTADMSSTFEWIALSNANITGESLTLQTTNPISNTLTNIATSTQVVNYHVNAISTLNGCKGPTQNIAVTVYPKPVLTSAITNSRCNNIAATYLATSATAGTTYTWSRPLTAGISNAASSGTGASVTETLNNTTDTPVNATYSITLTANGCSNTQLVTVTVIPTPTLTGVAQQSTVCAGTPATINLSGLLPNITTTITYTINGGATQTVTGITGNNSGTGSFVTPVLSASNNGQVLQITGITTTSTSSTCSQAFSQNTVLSVTPIANLSSSLTPPAICSGSAFNYTPTSTIAGVTFSWSRAVISGISQSASNGTGSISETLTNTTINPVNVTYQITTTNNGCSNTPQNVIVNVNPQPAISPVADIQTCDGTIISTINFNGSVTGTTYSWTNNNTDIGLAASGSGNISSFTASSTSSITATITVTPYANGCSGPPEVFSISVRKAGSWIGVVSTDWFDPNNWDCSIVPTASIDATIPATAPFMPIVNGAGAVCKSLNVDPGASFCTSGSNNIDIYGNWVNNGSCLHNTGTVTFKGATSTILGGSNNDFYNIVIIGTLTGTSGNINVAGNWTNNNTYNHNGGTVTFNGISMQTIGGTQPTTFRNFTANSAGITLMQPTTIEGTLTLTSGEIITTATNILILTNTAVTGIGHPGSFVQGPMKYIVATGTANTARNFPIGKDADWRPAVLTVSHTDAIPVTYTAEVINQSADSLNYTLPATVDRVSNVRWWQIDRQSIANFIAAKVQLYYDSNDGVIDHTFLTVVKTIGTGTEWFDVGGTATANTTGSITSDFFNTFSKFTLGNRIGGPNPLPVELVDFSAKAVDKTVELNWITATEINNDHFTIEKTKDGNSYTEVAIIKGAGTTNTMISYKTVDTDPYAGKSYYRLKQTDFDGKYSYSDLKPVQFSKKESVMVFPNPSEGTGFNILVNDMDESPVLVSVYNASGKAVFKNEKIVSHAGMIRVNLDAEHQLAKGVYFVRVNMNGEVLRSKIIVK